MMLLMPPMMCTAVRDILQWCALFKLFQIYLSVFPFLVQNVATTNSSRRLTRSLDEKSEYKRTCDRIFSMKKNRLIHFNSFTNGRTQYPSDLPCEWNFVRNDDCNPAIQCERVDLRCTAADTLTITDGVNGGLELCNDSHIGQPFKPESGQDLFAIFQPSSSSSFDRTYKGFRCEVKCASENAKPLPTDSNIFKTEDCECGIEGPSSNRVVGGKTADEFEFPWIVSLVAPGTNRASCAGTLINSDFVVSAAHCFQKGENYDALIHAHDLTKKDDVEHRERRQISVVKCHKWFNKRSPYDYDVCLLKLSAPVDIKKHSPACLPKAYLSRNDDESTVATVAGWGALREGGSAPSKLQKVNVPLIKLDRCARDFNYKVTDTMICAGYAEGGMDACQGDSGGPFITRKAVESGGHKATLIGIVSWGVGCAGAGKPGVYSRVSEFVPWIRKNARSGTWCNN